MVRGHSVASVPRTRQQPKMWVSILKHIACRLSFGMHLLVALVPISRGTVGTHACSETGSAEVRPSAMARLP